MDVSCKAFNARLSLPGKVYAFPIEVVDGTEFGLCVEGLGLLFIDSYWETVYNLRHSVILLERERESELPHHVRCEYAPSLLRERWTNKYVRMERFQTMGTIEHQVAEVG